MRPNLPTAFLPLFLSSTTLAADPKETKPCTVYNPSNGNTYDLNTITVQPLVDHKKAHKDDRIESWHARGYDYDTNFTMNFCAPVIEKMEDVVGIEEELWKNVSAFYTVGKKTYSIGYALWKKSPSTLRHILTVQQTGKHPRSHSSEVASSS